MLSNDELLAYAASGHAIRLRLPAEYAIILHRDLQQIVRVRGLNRKGKLPMVAKIIEEMERQMKREEKAAEKVEGKK